MKRVLVRNIYEDMKKYDGASVTVGGWVRNLRDSKAFGFIDLNDGSYFKSVQVVFEREKVNNYVHSITSYVEKIEQALDALNEKVSSLGDQKTEALMLHELMLGQVEMLQEIFLVSSLPQFEKDRICKRVEEMKHELKKIAPAEASHAEE